MGILFTLLRKVWWVIPIACALAWGAYERFEATKEASRASNAEQQLGSAEQSIAQLRTGIQAQNGAVERILQQGQANVAAASASAAQRSQSARRVRVIYRTRVERIQAAKVPTDCASAAAWAQQQAQGLAARWNK